MALINNSSLAATGVLFSANTKYVSALNLTVDVIGNGSTITIEQSSDNSSWSALASGFNVTTGSPVAIGGATVTSKGRYWFNVAGINFVRFRVSTYVGPDSVTVRYDESTADPRLINMFPVVLSAVATGSTYADALDITANRFFHIATAASGTGVRLPIGLARGVTIDVRNGGANAVLVYPPVGFTLNAGAVNASQSLASAGARRFVSLGDNNWYSAS